MLIFKILFCDYFLLITVSLGAEAQRAWIHVYDLTSNPTQRLSPVS